MMDEQKQKVEAEVSADFAALESEAQKQPGLVELLSVYGGYEAAVKRADEYLSLLNPPKQHATTNATTQGI